MICPEIINGKKCGMMMEEFTIPKIKVWFLVLRRAKIRRECSGCGYEQ